MMEKLWEYCGKIQVDFFEESANRLICFNLGH